MYLLDTNVWVIHDCTVVTHNCNEFQRVPGLKIEDWEAQP